MSIARYLGYGAFFVSSFLVGLYWTFPWDVAKDRILDLVNKNAGGGMEISAASLEPSWVTGFVAEGVEIRQKDSPPIKIEKIKARVGLIALLRGKTSVSAKMPLGKGQIEAEVMVDDNKIDLDAHIDKVQLEAVPSLPETLGVPLQGKVSLDAKMVVGKKDPRITEGNLTLKTSGLKMDKGGKLSGFSIPVGIDIGDVELQIPVKEGKATIKNAQVKGNDLELMIDGTINAGYPFSKSTMNVNVNVKPTDKLLSSDPMLKALLNNFSAFKSNDGFFGIALAGALNRPHFTARRP